FQRRTQALLAALQPAFERAEWTTKPLSDFLAGNPFQVAKHYGFAVFHGQPTQLLVEGRQQFARAHLRQWVGAASRRRLAFVASPANGGVVRLARRIASNFVQPAGDRFAPVDSAGLASQRKKGCLESVLCVRTIWQDAGANAQHHWPVPAQQHGERLFIAP